MSADYGKEMTVAAGHMDKVVSGFIRTFEEGYSRLEAMIRGRGDKKTGRAPGSGGGRERSSLFAGLSDSPSGSE